MHQQQHFPQELLRLLVLCLLAVTLQVHAANPQQQHSRQLQERHRQGRLPAGASAAGTHNRQVLFKYDNVNLQRCYAALLDADVDANGEIDADEHLLFLQTFGPSSSSSEFDDYWMSLQEKPLELRTKFHAIACFCMEKKDAKQDCCLGDKASIDISGIARMENDNDTVVVSRQEQEYLETVCILTQQAIDQVERERIENEESKSAWLRTQFQVTLMMADGQQSDTEPSFTTSSSIGDLVSQDLVDPMNMLVEQVLEEESGTQRRLLRVIGGGGQPPQSQPRILQEIQYLPTQVESTPTDCGTINVPLQNECATVSTTTYVVGPTSQLDISQLESALSNAIALGRLQTLVDEVHPDSTLRVLDNTVSSDEQPTNEDGGDEQQTVGGTSSSDDNVWTYPGVIVGLVVAGVVATLVLASVVLVHGKRKRTAKREQLLASQQGSLINMELVDTSVDKDLTELEEGRLLGSPYHGYDEYDDDDDDCYHDEYGVPVHQARAVPNHDGDYDDDAIPVSPSPTETEDPSAPSPLVLLPNVGRRPTSTKEPSEGDLGASDNHMDQSYSHGTNSSAVMALSSKEHREASIGSLGVVAAPPIADSTSAMEYDVVADTIDEDEDTYYGNSSSGSTSTSTSSSSSSDDSDMSDDDNDDISSSAVSLEYDGHGIMTESAFEAKMENYRESMQARSETLKEDVVAQSAPAMEPSSNAGIIAGATLGAVALGGAAGYAAAQYNDETDAEEQDVEDAIRDGILSSPQATVAVAVDDTPCSSNREIDSTGEKIMCASNALVATPLSPPSQQARSAPIVESDAPLQGRGTPSTDPDVGVIAGVTAGAVGAIALGGAALYAATRNSEDSSNSSPPQNPEVQSISNSPETTKNAQALDSSNDTNMGVFAGATAADVGGVAMSAVGPKDSEEIDNESKSRTESRVGISPPPQLQSEGEVNGDGRYTTLSGIAAAGAVSFASIYDPVAAGEESQYNMEREDSVLGASSSSNLVGASSSSNLETQSESETHWDGSTTLSSFAVAGAASLRSIHDPTAVGEESHCHLEDSSDESTPDTSSPSYVSSADVTSFGMVEDPVAVREESHVTDDPVAVGEESVMVEHHSSLSGYSSEDAQVEGIAPLGAFHRTQEQYAFGREGDESTTMESRSSYTPEGSNSQMEELSTLRPPPRPPSPSDTGQHMPAATLGIVGVGATAAYLAARDHDDESPSISEGDSASEGTTDREASTMSIAGDGATNNDSEVVTGGLPPSANAAPAQSERLRPPANGSTHPYYATAAAMTANVAAVGTEAIYETSLDTIDAESVSSSDSSSSESSSDSDSSSYTDSSSSEETTDSESSDDISMSEGEQMGDNDVGAMIPAVAAVASTTARGSTVDDSNESNSGPGSDYCTTSATVGQQTERETQDYTLVGSKAASHSNAVVATSISSISIPSDAAVVQGDVLSKCTSLSSGGGGNDTEVAVATRGIRNTRIAGAVSMTAAATEPTGVASAQASGGNPTGAIFAGAVAGGAAPAGAADYVVGRRASTDDESDISTDDVHTTDDESSEDDEDVTNVAIAAPRSTSRSTFATSYTGTQTTSRSTLETSGSLQGPYQGQDISSRTYSRRESHSSLPKSGMDSGGAMISAAVVVAVKPHDSDNSSSDADSSSSFDSDSSDDYYSPDASNSSSKSATSAQLVGADAAEAAAESSVKDRVASISVKSPPAQGHIASLESSSDAIVTESATGTLTESGDTFLAMEEAAAFAKPGEVDVTRTRFALGAHATREASDVNEANSDEMIVAATGASVIGAGAALLVARKGEDDNEAELDNESDSSDSHSVGSSSSDSSSESESSDGDSGSFSTSSGYSTVSECNMSNHDHTSGVADTVASAIRTSPPEKQNTPTIETKEDGVVQGSVASGPAGPRARLLGARSDAMLPRAERDESLQTLLTDWDHEYDLTTGAEETTGTSDESLVVQYANSGLPPIEESGQSDGSSQSLTSADAPPSGDSIAASMQHGSSSLLNFDYSLCTVAEEQSGYISYSEGHASVRSGEHAVTIDAAFEKEVLAGLDPIAEHSEAVAGRVASNRSLPEAKSLSSTGEAKAPPQAGQVIERDELVDSSGKLDLQYDISGSYSRSTVSSKQRGSKDAVSVESSDNDDDSSASSSSSSSSSSEYTTDSTGSSEDSDSSNCSNCGTDPDDSSSTSSTPTPSFPDLHRGRSSSSDESVARQSTGETQVEPLAVASARIPSKEERDAVAESEGWAAIAAANKPNSPDKGAADAAEWAIKRSLSALRVAEEQASSLTSSSASSSSSLSSSSSDDLFSSDLFSSDANSEESQDGII